MIIHNTLLKRALTIIFGCAFLCLALSGCNNFLNAEKVSNEIKDAIAYNNARAVNVALSCKDEEGSLFPQPTYQAKLGYAFEVQFIPNTQNYLITDPSTMLKAVSRINDESRAEYVEFTPIEQTYEDKKSGLYRVNVKVVQYADDIKICPNGTLIPKVNEIYPPYNPSGYNQDTMIKVTFNKPVDPESFGDFSCIRFESAGQDISDCYGTPFFSSDNLVLNIPTVPGKKIIAEQAQNNAAEVILKIVCTNLKDTDGLSITHVEPYTYCVNRTTDSIAPHIKSYEMTTTGNTEAWYYRTLTDKAVLQWSYAQVLEDDNTTVKYYYGDYSRNHVGKSVHIKLQGYDNADAISGLLVREVFEKDISGNAAGENELTKFVDDFEILTDSNGNPVLSEDGKIIYSFDFDYVLQSKGDGLVLLELHLKDGANNGDYIDYEVIKQSETNKSIRFVLELDKTKVLPQLVDGKYKSHLRVPSESSSHYFALNTNEKMYLNYLSATTKFSFYLFDENDIPSEVFTYKNFTTVPNSSYSVETEFNEALKDVLVDSYRDTKVKAVYYEENGLTKEFEFIIPSAPDGIFLSSLPSIETTYGTHKGADPVYITYQTNENAVISKEWTTINETILSSIQSTSETTTYPYGLYTIYPKRKVNVLTCNGFDSSITSAYGKPILYKKQGSGVNSFTIAASIKNKTYEPSTGMATVEFDLTYPEDGKTYYIVVNSPSNSVDTYYSKPNGKSVILPNGYDYIGFHILKINPNSGIEAVCGINEIISLKTVDNFPPTMTFSKSYWDTSYFYIYSVNITDKKEGLVNNTNHGITNFDCYYSKTDLGDNPSVETAEQMSVLKKTINFETDPSSSSRKCAKIPFSDVEQGEYYLYAYLKDNNSNGKLKLLSQQTINSLVHGVYFSLRDATPYVKKNANKKLELKIPQEYSDSVKMYRYRLESQGGKWAWVGREDGDWYSYNSSNTDDYDATKDYFMMVSSREFTGSWGSYHLKPLYYYPNYENGDIPCLSTSWMKVDNGWHIFCDAPAFCHTLYSKRKITSGNSKKDASEWEAQAQETGIVFSQNGTDFTYKDTNLAEIPDNSWYTTICHFADGTVLMSPVEQMHR